MLRLFLMINNLVLHRESITYILIGFNQRSIFAFNYFLSLVLFQLAEWYILESLYF